MEKRTETGPPGTKMVTRKIIISMLKGGKIIPRQCGGQMVT